MRRLSNFLLAVGCTLRTTDSNSSQNNISLTDVETQAQTYANFEYSIILISSEPAVYHQ